MKEISIVPRIIRSEEIVFTDDNQVNVSLCPSSNIKFVNTYRNPFFIVDKFATSQKVVTEIRKIDLPMLEKLGYRLVSLATRWANISNIRRGQRVAYILEKVGNPIPHSEVLRAVPREHWIEFDVDNKRVRIKGRNAYPYLREEDASRWIDLK